MANFRRKRSRAQARRVAGCDYYWPPWYRMLKVMREREAKRELAQELERAAEVAHGAPQA